MSDEHLITGELRDASVDREAVFDFAEKMVLKLEKNRHKQHWSVCDTIYLFDRLFTEVVELKEALDGKPVEDIISECCDVANFAMMIADNLAKAKKKDGLREEKKEIGRAHV